MWKELEVAHQSLGVRGLGSASLLEEWREAMGPAVTLPGRRPVPGGRDKPLKPSAQQEGGEPAASRALVT